MSAIEKKITDLIADPAGLRAWLEAQPETRSFRVASSDYCPLACYLTEQLNLEPARVNVWQIIAAIPQVTRSLSLPIWACEFVGAVNNYGDGAEVSRDQALSCLDRGDV